MWRMYGHQLYHFLETIPDRLYPFTAEIEGTIVRGKQAYAQAVERAFLRHGPNQFGFELILYRSVFHMIGALLFASVASLVSEHWIGTEAAIYVFIAVAALALYIQEFYSHPKRFGQTRMKSYADWLTWVIPMILYLVFV